MVIASREKLVSAAQAFMLAKGYSATGVDDICQQAGVSKGAFYHQFTSKEELALAALEDFYERGLQKLLAIDLRGVPDDERWLAFIDAVAERSHEFWQEGCLIGSLASEMARSSEPLQAGVSRLFTQMAEALEPLIQPFVDSLHDDSLTAESLAEQFLIVVEGAIIMARAHRDPARIKRAIVRFAEPLRSLKNTEQAREVAKKRKKP